MSVINYPNKTNTKNLYFDIIISDSDTQLCKFNREKQGKTRKKKIDTTF